MISIILSSSSLIHSSELICCFKKIFIYFHWRLITLQYCGVVGIAIHQHESASGVNRTRLSPHPEPPTHVPPHPIPLGCPKAPALSALLHALNLHWSPVLHMVIYMFQYTYCLKLPHPCLLPHVQKSVSYICLFCCLAYRVVITVFLNSIYMC